jgi:protein SCO1/2
VTEAHVAETSEEAPRSDPVRAQVAMIAAFAVALLVVGLVIGFTRSSVEAEPNWVELGEPVEMPDVVLTDTDGRPYDLRTEQDGRVTLLYFGYLSCPDACPIHMAVLGGTFEQLAPEMRSQIDVVFITTDPDRDSPEDIGDFLGRFEKDFIGLTGSEDALRDAQVASGVPVAVQEPVDENGDYLVGHATQVLVFDTDGIARRVYPFGVRQSDWLVDLPKLVES